MIRRLPPVFVVALLLVSQASANAGPPTLAQLEHEVMCPICHTLLELSHAPIADRMRSFIRQRIAAGDSGAEIKNRLVAQFGEGVLAAPPAKGFGLVAWLLPIGGSLAIAVILAVALRQWKHDHDREATPATAAPVSLDAALSQRLDRELAAYDD